MLNWSIDWPLLKFMVRQYFVLWGTMRAYMIDPFVYDLATTSFILPMQGGKGTLMPPIQAAGEASYLKLPLTAQKNLCEKGRYTIIYWKACQKPFPDLQLLRGISGISFQDMPDIFQSVGRGRRIRSGYNNTKSSAKNTLNSSTSRCFACEVAAMTNIITL